MEAGWMWLPPVAGLLAGLVMGYAARRRHFCTMSSLERHWYAEDSTGLRTWGLAALVALLTTQGAVLTGLVEPDASIYVRSNLALAGIIVGGLAFGIGMALVGTCGFGALVRLGGGSLRSLVVLVALGLAAASTQRGMFLPIRQWFDTNLGIDMSAFGGQSLGGVMSSAGFGPAGWALATIVFALPLAWWVLRDASYRARKADLAAGITIGLAITFGWIATSVAAAQSFSPVRVESASFAAPVGDALVRFAISFNTPWTYGMVLVIGVAMGAAIAARQQRDVRWEACDDARELGRHIAGGALMGVGGVLALGCTIGQGVSAFSLLAISAPIAMAAVFLGARLGLSYLVEGTPMAAFWR